MKWLNISLQHLYNIGQMYERVRKRSRESDRDGFFPHRYNISIEGDFFALLYRLAMKCRSIYIFVQYWPKVQNSIFYTNIETIRLNKSLKYQPNCFATLKTKYIETKNNYKICKKKSDTYH